MTTIEISRRAIAHVARHGLNVYPLEAYGLLVGEPMEQGAVSARVLAVLPVGKTEQWEDPAGRFARISLAVDKAAATFATWGLAPIGTYCTLYSSSGDYYDQVLGTAPHIDTAPWLILRGVDGGETIWGFGGYQFLAGGWREAECRVVSVRVDQLHRNPKRVAIEWNRAWGVLDYGNNYATELPRLGLPLP